MNVTRFELPRLFPDLGVSVVLEFVDGRRVSARLAETAQGIRWIKNGTGDEACESWGQWSPEVRAWETRT